MQMKEYYFKIWFNIFENFRFTLEIANLKLEICTYSVIINLKKKNIYLQKRANINTHSKS